MYEYRDRGATDVSLVKGDVELILTREWQPCPQFVLTIAEVTDLLLEGTLRPLHPKMEVAALHLQVPIAVACDDPEPHQVARRNAVGWLR